MPITPTYPGVYVEEIPSGVRTITGVSTSVTVFVGAAKRGPINRAVRLLSYADYERNFGGLDAASEVSYAVRQFFLNGGSEAWVVRLANNARCADRTLQYTDVKNSSKDVLTITAIDEGKSGEYIEVRVDYNTDNPASTFNLTFNYISPDNPTDRANETFKNLSMNEKDPRFVETVINDVSNLVTVERIDKAVESISDKTGESLSGDLTDDKGNLIDVSNLIDDTHKEFRVVVNGLPPVTVQLASITTTATNNGKLNSLCDEIQKQVRAYDSNESALAGFTCKKEPSDNNLTKIKMTSGKGGENSSVRVLPGLKNDISSRLKLGTLNGGVETDTVAAIRPDKLPPPGTLTSGDISDDAVNNGLSGSFQININGYGFESVTLPASNNNTNGEESSIFNAASATSPENTGGENSTPAAENNLETKLLAIATDIQSQVRELKPNNPAYENFRCVVIDGTENNNKKLKLISGIGGEGSSVVVAKANDNNIVETLKLLTKDGAIRDDGKKVYLQGGTESPYTEADAYNLFIASRSERKGIYALESVVLFNILCLPGETNQGLLMDAAAYCQERRAFLIADAPKEINSPVKMEKHISEALPKTEYGAVYYPWIYLADPLQNGKPRLCPPSGTIAGLYARTDSNRGVWKAPAGTEANLVGVQKVAYLLTDRENGILNPLGVNCLRIFPVYGAVAWGARTLRGADTMTSEWKYIPVRRTALYIEESLYRGLKWVVFEPNDEPLWSQIRLNVGAFMQDLFRQGAFQGKTPREAYLVKCDRETTTQNDINLGIVNILVGFAPLKPAEFVFLKIQQLAGQIQT